MMTRTQSFPTSQPVSPGANLSPRGPLLSVVISSRDRPESLRKCLESIRRNTRPPDEIVVVDSASTEPEAVARVASGAGARYLRTELPGSARARNIGTAAARGDLIAFTDDDAVVDPEWLEALAEAFNDAAAWAVVGPVFELGASPPRLLYSRFGFDPAADGCCFSRLQPDWFDRVALGAIGFGANMAARRAAFERAGWFREGLGAGAPIGGDENYFHLALVERGGVVVNQPRARVYHPAQSPERLRETRRAIVAYQLYVLATCPHLRWPILRRWVRQLARRELVQPNAALPVGDLVTGILISPRLLLTAWRLECRPPEPAVRVRSQCEPRVTW